MYIKYTRVCVACQKNWRFSFLKQNGGKIGVAFSYKNCWATASAKRVRLRHSGLLARASAQGPDKPWSRAGDSEQATDAPCLQALTWGALATPWLKPQGTLACQGRPNSGFKILKRELRLLFRRSAPKSGFKILKQKLTLALRREKESAFLASRS
jgi:hypothetical protein